MGMEGAREVTMHWAAHIPRVRPGPEGQDFKKLNKKAATQGVTDAKQLKEWKKDNTIKISYPSCRGGPTVIPSDVIPSFAYGRKSRPSTPIVHVVGNQYGMEQEEALDMVYKSRADQNDQPNGRRVVRLTIGARKQMKEARSQRQLRENPPPETEPWKMSK